MGASVKRRNLFVKCRKKLDVDCQRPNVDSLRRWDSILTMIKRAFPARRISNAVVSREKEMGDVTVTEMKWKVVERLCAFSETSAAVIKTQSGQKYVTLSMDTTLYQKLCKGCGEVIDGGDAVLDSFATKMLKRLRTAQHWLRRRRQNLPEYWIRGSRMTLLMMRTSYSCIWLCLSSV